MKIEIFGYCLWVKVFKMHNHVEFGRRGKTVSKPTAKVMKSGEYLMLTDPDGVKIPRQIDLEIHDYLDQPISATVRLYVDLSEIGNEAKPYEEKNQTIEGA